MHLISPLMPVPQQWGEPGLAGCPLNSPSPIIPRLCILCAIYTNDCSIFFQFAIKQP